MAIFLDVQASPDREQIAAVAAEIRAKVRDAVHAGIADALGDLAHGKTAPNSRGGSDTKGAIPGRRGGSAHPAAGCI